MSELMALAAQRRIERLEKELAEALAARDYWFRRLCTLEAAASGLALPSDDPRVAPQVTTGGTGAA